MKGMQVTLVKQRRKQEHHKKHAKNALIFLALTNRIISWRVRQELFTENPPTTFEEFCAALLALDEDDLQVAFEDISIILVEMDLYEATQASIFRCLSRAV
jgi:hypothetical protein